MQWFDVDKQGLAKVLERRGKAFALLELVQNALDTEAAHVEGLLEPIAGRPLARVRVEDDDPQGFSHLSDAFTLFAESTRKGDPEKRGRFGLGEKLVLAMCEEASIKSTTGTVTFDTDGRHTSRVRTEKGSVFQATMRMTREELTDAIQAIRSILVPSGVSLSLNGIPILSRSILEATQVELPTVLADEDGFLRKSVRKSMVQVVEPLPGEVPHLYEMGIPIVPLTEGVRYHVNVTQKIPLNMDRDNVTPAYQRLIHVTLLNLMATRLTKEDATARWVTDAVCHPAVTNEAVTTVVANRYGEKRVIYDPSDREGTMIATSRDYTVIPGGAFPSEGWDNIRRAGAALPAGQVTPSPKPFSPGGAPLKLIAESLWSPEMRAYATFVQRVSPLVTFNTRRLRIEFTNTPHWGFGAVYGRDEPRLILNLAGRPGTGWWFNDKGSLMQTTIHELAHHEVSNHLSEEFHEECCRIGAAMTRLALEQPDVFRKNAD